MKIQPPSTNTSQSLDSILRMWDAFFRRASCEILGSQAEALPRLAGMCIRTLQEDRFRINCLKDDFSTVVGGTVILSRKEKSFIFEPTLVLNVMKLFQNISQTVFCCSFLFPKFYQLLDSVSYKFPLPI
jgi:hypothetical protein